MALTTYPLNEVDYSAEDAELFHCTRSSGVYAGDDFAYTITGTDNTITIGQGLAWIRNSKFSGKAAALKAAETKELAVADTTYPRIDVIAIRFDANTNDTTLVVKQGTAGSTPVIPAISRTEAVYELYLYAIRREAGATAITAADITDLRLDPAYCGLMADSVTRIDTDAIYAQLKGIIQKLNGMTILRRIFMWQNASPLSSFAEQTLEGDYSEFSHALVICKIRSSDVSSGLASFWVTKQKLKLDGINDTEQGEENMMQPAGDYNYLYSRTVKLTDTGITFGSGKMTNYCIGTLQTGYMTSVGTNDYNLVPVEIYGIKGENIWVWP